MAPAQCVGAFIANRARQTCRARFERPRQNRPVAAIGQAATGWRASILRAVQPVSARRSGQVFFEVFGSAVDVHHACCIAKIKRPRHPRDILRMPTHLRRSPARNENLEIDGKRSFPGVPSRREVFPRDDIGTSSQLFFKPVVSVWFGVERLDLNVSRSPIESDRFKKCPICL